MIRRTIAAVLLTATPLAACALAGIEESPAYAAGGTTDPSFGGGSGFAGVSASDTNVRFFAAPTGEPVIAASGTGIEWDADGKTLNGWSGNSGINFPTDAAMDSSGRVVVIGGNPSGRLNVARYSGGVLDSTFGTGGVVNLTYGPNGSQVTTAPDGSVMVWADGYLAKLTPSGVLDTSWNPTGTTPGVEFVTGVWGMRFQSDGHLVVICAMNWQQNDPCLRRLNADGSTDTAFGGSGQAPGFSAQGLGQTEYWTVAVGADDSIYAGGADLTNAHAVLAKYSASGTPDANFGDSGVAVNTTAATAGGTPQFRYLALANDSLYAGMVNVDGAGAVARYTLAGQPDPAFAANGQAVVPVAQPNNTGSLFGLAVQPSGKVLAAVDSGGNLYVYRLQVDGVDPVSALSAAATSSGAQLSWANPSTPSFDEAIVRAAEGQTAPSTATSGSAVYTGSGSTAPMALAAGHDYAVSVFVSDFAGTTSTGAVIQLQGTTVTTTTPKTMTYGSATTISGTLKTIHGTALTGKPVTLYGHPTGATTWTKIATMTTNSSGTVSKSVSPSRSFVYQFAFGGATALLHSARALTITVKPRFATTWGPLTFSDTTGTYVKGTLAPTGVIQLQQLASGSWRTVAKIAGTSFRFAVKPKPGKSTYRLLVPAQSGRAATTSSSKTLTSR